MNIRTRGMFAATVLAMLCAAAALDASGNGGFVWLAGHGITGKHGYINVYVDCRTENNYVCGLTSVEVDWDDGSAFDNYVGYLPINEAEFDHDYYENGTYYPDVSADDDHGNWAAATLTLVAS